MPQRRDRLGDRPRCFQEELVMKARKTSVVVLSALLALGSAVLASVPAEAVGRSGFHWKGGHGWHGGFHHHRHFGFYSAPLFIGSYYGVGCYFVKKPVFIPGRGFVKRSYRICDGFGGY
jgi:hypothetical protein